MGELTLDDSIDVETDETMTLNKKQVTDHSSDSDSDSMDSESDSDTAELDTHKDQDMKKIVEIQNDTLDGNTNIETNFKKLRVSVLREMVFNKKLVDSKNKAKKLKKEQLINLLRA